MTAQITTGMNAKEKKLIYVSSLGTLIAWYNFYLSGVLASVLGKQYFSYLTPSSQFIVALLVFALGFLVRPFGALFFDRLNQVLGKKYTFLITTLMMGLSTFVIACLPGYATIGVAAPVLLVVLRALQGLALGGEYSGAATYVAKHAPTHRRGFYTSWIQMTATLGLMLALLAVILCREMLGSEFDAWGWRLPFALSALLLVASVWIRQSLNDSVVFQKMREHGAVRPSTLKEKLGSWRNTRLVIVALLGLTAGQAVVWYSGQFYALFFLTTIAKVDTTTANLLMVAALLLGAPFFVFFGALSDKLGRKVIIMSGCLLAALSYFWVFPAMLAAANPSLAKAQKMTVVIVSADPETCAFQGSPLAREIDFTSSCDQAKRVLAQNYMPYVNKPGSQGEEATIQIGDKVIQSVSGELNQQKTAFTLESATAISEFRRTVLRAAKERGLTAKADEVSMNKTMVLAALLYLVVLVAMVYGPLAALLFEMFPRRHRRTSLSLPYHIGNGWFGGLLAPIAFAMVAASGDIYFGLWYPVWVALGAFLIGVRYIELTRESP
jgi:MFS family permease